MHDNISLDDTDQLNLSSLVYLGTIERCPLLWDDREHCPVWPEGEPMDVSYHSDGTVCLAPRCDVSQAWWTGALKPLDCGHQIQAPSHYVTWLETQREVCVDCASREGHA